MNHLLGRDLRDGIVAAGLRWRIVCIAEGIRTISCNLCNASPLILNTKLTDELPGHDSAMQPRRKKPRGAVTGEPRRPAGARRSRVVCSAFRSSLGGLASATGRVQQVLSSVTGERDNCLCLSAVGEHVFVSVRRKRQLFTLIIALVTVSCICVCLYCISLRAAAPLPLSRCSDNGVGPRECECVCHCHTTAKYGAPEA